MVRHFTPLSWDRVLKASLASATSLIALLVFQGGSARAATLTLSAGTEPSPQFTYTTNVDNFGDVLVSVASGAFANIATYSNSGGGTSSVSWGTTTGVFAGGGQTTTAGSHATVTDRSSFTFTPTVTGTATAVKVTVTAGGASSQILTLTGTGVAPVLNSVTGNVNAGYVLVTQSTTAAVTVSNSGNGNLANSNLTAAGKSATLSNLNGTLGTASSGGFSGGTSVSLTDSSSTTYNYVFKPTGTGTATTTVVDSFSNGGTNNAASSATTTLAGTGVAPVQSVAISNTGTLGGGVAATGSVGNVLVGSSVSAIVTVTDIGNGDLATGGGTNTINNLNGSAGSASNSVFVGTGGTFNIKDASGGSSSSTTAAYTYNFTPTATGAQTATVITAFTNGATGGTNLANTVTSALSGTGVAPVANVSGSASAGYVLVTQSAAASVTVSNSGNGNLSGLGTISNLRGSVGAASGSGFSGAGGTLAIGTAAGLTDTTSTTYSYVYTPTTRGAASTTVVSTFVNGNGVTNSAGTLSTTLLGTGVAPVNSVTATPTALVRIGTTGAGAATVSISNIGNGNLSGAGTISNLNGTVSNALGTGFSTSSGTTVGLADAASTTLGYTYTPLSHATSSTTATISFSNGNTAGTNTAQTITASVSAQGVGPTYQSKIGATVDTPTAVAHGATASTGPTISFFVASKSTQTLYLNLGNITTDPNGGNASLTNLSIESFTFAGANAAAFSSTFTPGSVITEGGSILLPITVSSGALTGLLNSSLTIFTDESVGLGGTGDTFTYELAALIPEPASFAVIGAGLAGLACARRRRKAR